MAAAAPRTPLLLALLLLLPPPPPARAAPPPPPDLGRRFAERKRCADPECSMLMCRGKAMRDFKGPDCRFVNFKKGEAVYVYYKLIGESTELWAGSVGSDFGYFPKDLLEVNHNYSNEELELPTDETDFVCFDGGRDDFDNYNVDELLKSLQETIANEAETESNDAGTKPAEGIEKAEQADRAKSLGALETDNLEQSAEEEKENLVLTDKVDSSLTEGTENTGGDSSANSHKENSQGDHIAHEHLKGMLHGKLKGLESENTKNTSIPQGETSQLDQENEEVNAYTLLNRELSVNLKTNFGSTADAVVSDDEVTRLVTSLEDDLNEDLGINPHDEKEEPDFADQSAEIPLLSFTAEDEITSPVDLEDDGNYDVESQNHELEEDATGASKLNNQRDSEEEPNSDALILKDAFSTSKKLGDSVTADRSESKQTKEKQDEVVLISKREAPAPTQPEDLSKESLGKEPVGTGDLDSKEKANKTEQLEEQLTGGTESRTGALKGTPVPDPHNFPSPGNALESKSFLKNKEDASEPSDDDNKSPERVPRAPIVKGEKQFEDDTSEEFLESDLKHKRSRDKNMEKGKADNKPPVDVPAKPKEEVKNVSQVDLGDTDLLRQKVERGMPAVEKELLRHEEDLKQVEKGDNENKNPAYPNKELEIKKRNMKETPAGEGDPGYSETVEQHRPWENETEYSEADVNEEPSRNPGKMPVFEENIEKSSIEEKSKSTTENTNTENLNQQGTAHPEDAVSDRNLGKYLPKETTQRSELQSEDLGAEDDPDLKQADDELLEDENAASAKLSQARASNVQHDTLNGENTNPELEGLSEAVPNPTYKTGEETNSFPKEDETISMQNASDTGNKELDMPVGKDAKLDEMQHVMEADEESSEPEEPSSVEEHNFQSPGTEDSNDFDQRKDHLPEDISQKDSKEVQNLEHMRNDHQQSAYSPSPADSSGATNDTVTDFSESVKRLTIIRAFLDEKRVMRLHKYLGLQNVVRIEAMFHDMKVEMELAQKASQNNEDIEKALDQILEFSESSIMDVVGKVLDSRVAENKEEVVKEMDLYDEESALMDDIQELIYSLRSKYSSAGESVPLASPPEQEDDQLHIQAQCLIHVSLSVTDGAKEAEYDTVSTKNPNAIDEGNQEFQKLIEDKRPEQPTEEEESAVPPSLNVPPEHEEANFSDNGEVEEGYDSERGSLLEDTSFGSVDSGESDSEHIAEGNHLELAILLLKRCMLVATLPEEMRPGPDFHGLPWEPVIITALVGIVTLAIFFWRTCLSVSILRAWQPADIKEAKESVKVAQEQKEILSDETDTVKELEEANQQLDKKVKNLHTMLETERKKNEKKQNKVRTITLCLILSLVQIALNEAKLSEEKVKSELHHVQEENARLKKSKEQLLKEAEGWSERHSELREQIQLYQKTQKDIEETLAYKENEIEVLTNCIMQLKQLDMDSEAKKDDKGYEWSPGEDLANGELPDLESEKMKAQIKQMMDVSRVKTMLSIVEEDRNLLQSKLNDEVTARHELEEKIKTLEHDSSSLQSAKTQLENECKTLQQKVEILGELYQQKEMALQKKLTQEEYERQEKEQKLSAADEKAVLAIEEVKVYKQRIQDMEEELQKTERSYKNQIAVHEKKAHDNWLIARSAERALAEEKREAANLRQKLIEVNQKIIMLQRPVIVKPTPGRPDRQIPPRRGPLSRDGSSGPSPVSGGNPSPTQMIDVPARPLSAPRREGTRGEFGPSPFPGTPLMSSPVMGIPLPPPIRYGPPPPPLRGHFGPRPLPGDFLPSPRLGMRDLPPGPLPPPPDPRGYARGHPPFRPLGPPGPRDYPPGPRLPPQASRDYAPSPNRDLPPPAPRD
uniref:Transport and Golgi organization protein 1 homolog n=1 Tax=Malurus cyaneus samueli TaxID=2593467 RepID=A0A8C5TYG6_9PASS